MNKKNRVTNTALAACVLLLALVALPLAGDVFPRAKPEEVGLSSERLARINEMMQRHITAGEITGGVTLVARKGRVAHLEAHGVMDQDTKKPMAKDSVFRIASMTKPVTGVAIMMMMEEGKLRITDPVSKFIPEFKDMKVAVAMPAGQGPPAPPPAAAGQGRGRGQAPPRFYTVPADRQITLRDLLTHTSGLASGPMGSSTV